MTEAVRDPHQVQVQDQYPDLVQEPVQIEIGIWCYRCREYDHFANDCPNSEESEIVHLQQPYDLDENQMVFHILVPDPYEDLTRTTTQDTMKHLNL